MKFKEFLSLDESFAERLAARQEERNRSHKITQSKFNEIKNYYEALKKKSHEEIAAQFSKLSMGHTKSEPKSTLINTAVHNRFSEHEVAAYHAKRIEG